MTNHRHGVRIATLLYAALFLGVSAQACDSGDTPIFSCEAASGKKYIELCASSPMDAKTGYLEYRFGAQDRDGHTQSVELTFPARREGSLRRFFGATYTDKGIYTQSVRFETEQASYAVFTESKGMATTAAGVRVTVLRTGKTSTVSCSERPRFYIHELQSVLACDPATPVGKACIK